MFKLVVLSALLAFAAAEPGLISPLLAPTTYAATIAAPATTSTYVQHSSSYVAPTVYSDIAFPHFIKKRSPQFFNNYVAPYIAGAPLVTPYASSYVAPAPVTYSSSVVSTIAEPVHLIKKRSPQFFNNYVAPYVAGAPLVTPYASSYVAPAPITYSSSAVSTIAEPVHFIKKRSPQFFNNYVAPYVAGAPLVTPYASSYVASAPITYSSSVVSTIAEQAHFIKKRSAPLIAAPAPLIAPLASSYYATPLATSYSASINPYYSPYYSNYFSALPLIKK